MDSMADTMRPFAWAIGQTPQGYVHFMLSPAIGRLGVTCPMLGYSVEMRPEEAEHHTNVSLTLTAVFDVSGSGEFAGDDMRLEHQELVSWLRALDFIVSDDEAANPYIGGDRIRVAASMQVPKRESDRG